MILVQIVLALAVSLHYPYNLRADFTVGAVKSKTTKNLERKDLSGEGETMIRVTDSRGREAPVPKEPRRIVVLTAYVMEMIRLLGGVDRVVGTTSFIKVRLEYIPEAANIPDVGSSSFPNLELVARLKPDLVIAWKDVPGPALEETLGALGISVLRLDLSAQATLEKDIMTLAEILGEEAKTKAKRFIAWNRNLEMRLKTALALGKGNNPTVLVEHYRSRAIAGPPSSCYVTTTMAGGDNLGKNIAQTFSEMDEEWVIKQNPDFIIKLGIFFSLEQKKNSKKITESLKDEILKRPGWNLITAVKDGGVFILDEDLCGGPRGMAGAFEAAARFHKDLVDQGEAQNIKKEYVESFLNLPYEP